MVQNARKLIRILRAVEGCAKISTRENSTFTIFLIVHLQPENTINILCLYLGTAHLKLLRLRLMNIQSFYKPIKLVNWITILPSVLEIVIGMRNLFRCFEKCLI